MSENLGTQFNGGTGAPDPIKKDMHLDLVDNLYKLALQAGIEAEWNGKVEKAAYLYAEASRLKEKMQAGELYEPKF